jgi:L-alanine-DL-glutamate epimerase-like enolase superfamily enzyme
MRAAWPRPCRSCAGDPWGDPVGVEALMARADAHLPGHVYAKSALDIATVGSHGQAAGLPLHALLGGRRRPTCRFITPSPASSPRRWPASPARLRPKACAVPGQAGRIGRLAGRCRAAGQGARGGRARPARLWRLELRRDHARRHPRGPGAAAFDVMLEQPCATLRIAPACAPPPACR